MIECTRIFFWEESIILIRLPKLSEVRNRRQTIIIKHKKYDAKALNEGTGKDPSRAVSGPNP